VDALERFNRKERNLLVRDALGNQKIPVRLSSDYCSRIERELKTSVDPSQAWWATDYHFDWLAGALALHVLGDDALSRIWPNDPARPKLIRGTQEDIDLVVATDTHLILIEAKANAPFTGKQMRSKLQRFSLLRAFYDGLPGAAEAAVEFHLLLTSPVRSPLFSDIHWIPLGGRSAETLTVTRCDQFGSPAASEDYWRVRRHRGDDVADAVEAGLSS
jgi:hypothetical protein